MFLFLNFLEFFSEYFESFVGWICRCRIHEYGGGQLCASAYTLRYLRMYRNIRLRSRKKYTDGLIQWFFYKHRKMSELVIYCCVANQPQPGLKPQWFIVVIGVQVSVCSLGPLTGESIVGGSLERLASWHWCRPEVQTWLWAQGLSISAHSHIHFMVTGF